MPAGLRELRVADATLGLTYPAFVQYPTAVPAVGATVGSYQFAATVDAPVAPGRHPLAVVSHGGGGSPLLYRTITTHLAEHGWIVICPEHPGDNRNDRSLVNTDAAATRRARHASLAIDAVLADAALGPQVDRARIVAIGHSMGGFTALCLVGGQPWSRDRAPLAVHHDDRVRAAVLLAPASEWFRAPRALAAVAAPLLVYVAEHDPVTPAERVRTVLAALPSATPCEVREVPGGGHFAFLAPFPASMHRPEFPPSQDPPGFDRAAFHARLPEEIRTWLETTLVTRR